jgi:hypothetical protein
VTPRPWGVTTQSAEHIYVHVLDWHDAILTLPPAGEWDRIIVLQE